MASPSHGCGCESCAFARQTARSADYGQSGSVLENAREALCGFDEQRPDGRHHLRDAVEALIQHAEQMELRYRVHYHNYEGRVIDRA